MRKLIEASPLYSFIFFALPSLALFLQNIDKTSVQEVYRPLIICLIFWAALWVLLVIVVRNKHKRGLLLGCAGIFFFTFSFYANGLSAFYEKLGTHRDMLMSIFAAIAFAAAIFGVYRFLRSKRPFAAMTPPLNLMAVMTLLIVVGNIAFQNVLGPNAGGVNEKLPEQLATTRTPENLPDIYHIVLDAYGRADVLEEFYGHDNRPFLEELKARGFYVAEDSSSNYYQTEKSLSSMLNLQYHPGSDQPRFSVPAKALIRQSIVRRFLEQQGYTFITFASGFSVTEIYDADVYLQPRGALTEFERALGNTTPIRVLVSQMLNLRRWEGLTPLEKRIAQWSIVEKARSKALEWKNVLRRKRIRFILETLQSRNFDEGPVYVFAHILCPHAPFVFDKNGNPPKVEEPISTIEDIWQTNRELYAGQIEFINGQILDVVDGIQARSPDAIILLHGDHGPRFWSGAKEWEDKVKCYTGILSACYLPGGRGDLIFDNDVSLVNMFGIIFNSYFGTKVPRLKDGMFFPPPGEMHEFYFYGGRHIFIENQS